MPIGKKYYGTITNKDSRKALSSTRLLHAILTNPINIWSEDYFIEPYVLAQSPLGKRLVVASPNLVRHVLVANAENYGRDQLQARIIRRMIGQSEFGAEGADWRLQRKV